MADPLPATEPSNDANDAPASSPPRDAVAGPSYEQRPRTNNLADLVGGAQNTLELTPLRAHYLKKTLIQLEFTRELEQLTGDPDNAHLALSYLGPPFTPPPKGSQPMSFPFLRFMFNQFVITFLPRHDLFQSLINFGRGLIELDFRPYDKIELDFTIPATSNVPSVVWAVVDKDDVKAFKQDRYDLTFAKTGDNPAVPAHYSVLSEFADVSENMFKANPYLDLVKLLKDPATSRYFKSLSVSDMPMYSPESPISLTERAKHVVLTLEAPSSSNAADTLPLVQAIFGFVDYLDSKHFVLRPETKTKLKKVRVDMEEFLKRELKKEDEDASESKRAQKRKAEQERIARLSAAEQKKHDERERKRNLRKAQTRGAIRSRAG